MQQGMGGNAGHGHPGTSGNGFSPLARSTMNSNFGTIKDAAGFMSQMGSTHRNAAQPATSHAHAPSVPSFFSPASAAAAMRAAAQQGTTMRMPNSLQWRPNPQGTSMQAASDIHRRLGGQGAVRTGGLGDGWYAR